MKKVFIIHGWTYTTNAWDAFCMDFKSRGFEPVMLNVPGLTEASDKIWTLEEYVEWLRGKLVDEKDVVLVGHSNGGRIAIAFIDRYPEKVSKLILIDSAGIVHNEWPLRLKRKVFGVLAKIGKKLTSSTAVRKIFYKIISARDYERAPENMRETMKNLVKMDLVPMLSKISKPTLIIWGKKDKATPVSDGLLINSLIKGSKLTVMPDAGHSPHQSHPAWVAEVVAVWLS